jgi:hypothetical protein
MSLVRLVTHTHLFLSQAATRLDDAEIVSTYRRRERLFESTKKAPCGCWLIPRFDTCTGEELEIEKYGFNSTSLIPA